jgi:glutaminyl-peptide cyclotransferase
MRNRLLWIVPLLVVVAVGAWYLFGRAGEGPPPVYVAEVVAAAPHDDQAFTEGLFYHNGVFYEGTGGDGSVAEGISGVRKVNPETGEVLASQDLPTPYFGEGVIAWKDRLYEITWKDQKGFIYGLDDLAPKGGFDYKAEGWGLTQDGTSIIASDGTPVLKFLDPETFATKSTLTVTANGCPVKNLNELEWIDGQIYANIWQTDLIARIDPKTGKVLSFLDVNALKPGTATQEEVANGIAYDPAKKRIFVTGKHWPKMYEIRQGAKKEAPSDAVSALTTCAR